MSDFFLGVAYYIGVGMATLAFLTGCAIGVAALIDFIRWLITLNRPYR
jgi:hypothetical protein